MTIYVVRGPDGREYHLNGPANATADQLAAALGQHTAGGAPANLAQYRIRAPDGHTYSVTAPADASQADVLAYAKQHYGTASGVQTTSGRTPSEQDLIGALRRADAAGDTDGAQRIADMIQQQRAQPQGKDVGVPAAQLHGMLDAATFGLFDKAAPYIGAGLTHVVPGRTETVDQVRQEMQTNEAATSAAHPFVHGIGEVEGAIVGGGALERGGAAIAAKVAPKATTAVRSALALKQGQPVANAGRIAAHGAISGGLYGGTAGAVQGAQDDGLRGAVTEGAEGAAAGAAAGAVLAPAVTVGAKVIGAGARLLQGPAAAALRIVASKAKLPGETMDQAAQRVANAAAEFQSRFGRYPAPAELMNVSQAKEVGDTIRRTTSAQQFAAQAEERAAIARQAELSHAIKSGGATAAQTDVEANASADLTRALQPIEKTNVQPTPAQSEYLKASTPDLFTVLRGPAYATARDELTAHLNDGAPMSLRTVETLRQAAARGAQSADPVVAHAYKGLRDAVRGIGENVPEYADAMNQYARQMRFAENLPEGAKALNDGTTPSDFAAGFHNQQPTPIGTAAQEGQRVGLRTAASQYALRSPNAAAELSQRLADNEGLHQKLTTALGQHEAADVQRTGAMALKAGRGMAAAVPAQTTDVAQAAQVQGHAIRAAALGLHGGSTAFVSHNVEWLVSRLGLPRGTARKVAELSMDPKNTPAVLQYLRKRGSTAAQRHEFMDLARAAAARAGAWSTAAALRPAEAQ